MFADDLDLLAMLNRKYGPFPDLIVDVGGLERPTIADYSVTIELMKTARNYNDVVNAQQARYRNVVRPLSFLSPDYVIENPETDGVPIEKLSDKYGGVRWVSLKHSTIGTAILLSVLEHVNNPFESVKCLSDSVSPSGLVIVSVPWMFPHHHGPEDNWRFSPTGLRHVFKSPSWEILECDWRLRITADAGVLDIHTGKPQAIESCYLIARRT
jgi:hypothetical protein